MTTNPARSVIGFDTETHLGDGDDCPCGKRHYTATPPWVCSSLAGGPETRETVQAILEAFCPGGHHVFHSLLDGSWGSVLTGPNGVEATRTILALSDINVAHFASYDVAILTNESPGYIRQLAHDLGYKGSPFRVRCTQIREQSIATALDEFYGRKFSLAETLKLRFNIDVSGDKEGPDAWRLRYATLDGLPASRWPDKAVEYALMDAVYARLVFLDQSKPLKVDGNVVVDENGDVMAELLNSRMGLAVMTSMRVRGIRVDPKQAAHWIASVEAEANKGREHAKGLGIIRVNRCKTCDGRGFSGDYPNLAICTVCYAQEHEACVAHGLYNLKALGNVGSESTSAKQALVSWMHKGNPPMTPPSKTFPKGQISTSDEAFETALQTTDTIDLYCDSLFAKKQLSTYVPHVQAAMTRPGNRIWSWPNPIVTSNRTSWAKPNLTNPPRKGEYRESHIPEDGMVMASLDFSSNELRTHCQYNIDQFGFSRMGEVLNDPSGDVYLDFAANTLGISVAEATERLAAGDKVVKQNRQTHKIAVLGYPGGLGANSFIAYARGYGVKVDEETATRLKDGWKRTYPEMALHLERISTLSNLAGRGRFTMVDKRSGWVKGGCNFTSAANFVFQAPGGHVLKHASWMVWLGCYIDETSQMYGRVHPLIAIHDELIAEGDEATAHEWAHEMAERMVAAAEEVTPDMKHYVKPAIMRRWLKEADTVYDKDTGRLIPWEPKK